MCLNNMLLIIMSQRICTQLSLSSQREHDELALGDIFDVAADFVFIDNDWRAGVRTRMLSVSYLGAPCPLLSYLPVLLSSALLSHKYPLSLRSPHSLPLTSMSQPGSRLGHILQMNKMHSDFIFYFNIDMIDRMCLENKLNSKQDITYVKCVEAGHELFRELINKIN